MPKLNVHIPYKVIDRYLPAAVEKGLAPEIFFTADDLLAVDTANIDSLSKTLKKAGKRPSVHSPFIDLNLAATDPDIIRVTRSRFMQTLELADVLNAVGIVIHPGFDPFRFRGLEQSWLSAASRNLAPILKRAEELKVMLAVENIFDDTYAHIRNLIKHFDSPFLGHCFDSGHFNIFAGVPLSDWLQEMGPHICAMHIHDNHGHIDQHLPVGEGSFPFKYFAENLPKRVRWTTMEMHDADSVLTCMGNWQRFLSK